MARPRISDEEHARRGTTRPDRGHGASEPEPTSSPSSRAPAAPAHLDKEAKRLWANLAPQVKGKLARELLAELCEALATARQARRRVRKEGLVVKRGTGAQAAHPLLALVATSRGQALAFAKSLGLADAIDLEINDPADEAAARFARAESFLFGAGRPPPVPPRPWPVAPPPAPVVATTSETTEPVTEPN